MRATITDESVKNLKENRIFTTIDGRSRFSIGDVVFYDENTRLEKYSAILSGNAIPNIGSFSYSWSPLPSGLMVGRYCSIAGGLQVMGMNHIVDFLSTSSFTYDRSFVIFASCFDDFGVADFPYYPHTLSRPNRNELPVIGNDVWIGDEVTLARGITLGDGCIVAAQSVVVKSVAPYTIVGGNPARTIRLRFSDEIIDRLCASQWWKYKVSDLNGMRYDLVNTFLHELESKIEKDEIHPFSNVAVSISDLIRPDHV